MAEQDKQTVIIFKKLVQKHYNYIHKEIWKKIQARHDFKDIYCNPTTITKKTLQLSFAKRYHEQGPFRFVRLTIDLSDIVIDRIIAVNRMAEVVLFLEETNNLSA